MNVKLHEAVQLAKARLKSEQDEQRFRYEIKLDRVRKLVRDTDFLYDIIVKYTKVVGHNRHVISFSWLEETHDVDPRMFVDCVKIEIDGVTTEIELDTSLQRNHQIVLRWNTEDFCAPIVEGQIND